MDKDNQQNPQTLIPPHNDDSTVMQKTLWLCNLCQSLGLTLTNFVDSTLSVDNHFL